MMEQEHDSEGSTSKTITWRGFLSTTVIAVLLRFVVFVYFHDYLEDNISFVAPWSSFQRVRDALALWQNGLGLYAGDYHSMPWVAFAFKPVLNYDYLLLSIFTTFDLLAAYFTFRFTAEFLEGKTEKSSENAILAYNIYILNPLGVGVCAVFSLSSLVNLLLTAALYFNHKGRTYTTILLISLISQLNIYYICLLFAVDWKQEEKSASGFLVGTFTAALLYISNGLLANLNDVFEGNVMFFMRVDDHTPNMGNFWCIFTQVFPHYRLFFLVVFQVHAFIYVYPLWRILRDYPVTLWFVYLQVVAITSSYPTYADFCVYLPLFFSFSMYHKYYRLTYLITIALVISFATAIITLTQWIQTGSGNANFYFSACSTYVLSLAGLAYETVNAHLIDQDVRWSGLRDPFQQRFYLNVPAERVKLE